VSIISRGFRRKRSDGGSAAVPPGQYVTDDFPVLSAGPTPRTAIESWSFGLQDLDGNEFFRCGWSDLLALPSSQITVDIHCVTKWTKLGTRWKGVSFDALMAASGQAAPGPHVMAYCDGGYTTNLAVADLESGKGMIAYEYDGQPLAPEHGGPVRLLVPHLYFWKSAKWVRGLRFMAADAPGFWEAIGYHRRGDPWKEQRYDGD
jgi:DMSO/TMAO reductase YedYZ molybdopterin-dependent catalytic subunit